MERVRPDCGVAMTVCQRLNMRAVALLHGRFGRHRRGGHRLGGSDFSFGSAPRATAALEQLVRGFRTPLTSGVEFGVVVGGCP